MIEESFSKAINEGVSDSLSQGRACTLRVSSSSMHPFLKKGDMIVVKSIANDHVRKGDIVLFNKSDELCVHRCVGIRTMHGKKMVLTKGDHRINIDDPIDPESIIGSVKAIERDGKAIAYGRIFNYALAYFSYALWRMYDYYRNLKQAVIQHV